ncbi:MAG TPA: hypothetical protein VJ547_06685, partial [Candidatus Thermoplasmatota archaeon]|nr:hypothetical protein [Candidatus Thermoplasmatota archaeon]
TPLALRQPRMTPVPPPQPYPPQPYPQQPVAPGTYPPPPMYVAQPPMYAAPPMYMAPPPQPGAKTFEGLRWLRYGVTLALAFNLVAAIGGFLLTAGLASIGPATPPATILGALAAAVAIGIAAALLGFIGLILGLLGLYNVSQGKQEFGPAHQASVAKANRFVLFAVLATVAGIVATTVVAAIMFTNALTAFNPAAFQASMIASLAIDGVISVVVTLLLAIALQSYIERLMTAKGRALRGNFILFSVIGAGVALALGIVGALTFGGLLANPATAGTSADLSPLAGLISVLTMFWYRSQVMDAEQGCRNMISSGVLNPDGGAVPAMPVAAIAQPAPYMGQPPVPPPQQPPAGP